MTTPESQDHRQHSSQALHTETKSQSRHQQTTSSRHTARYDEARPGKQAPPKVQSSSKTRHGDTANEAAQSKSLSQRDNQSMASLGSERNPLRPQLRADTLRSHPTWSVKQNPFLVADREAKSKISTEPPVADNSERNKQPRERLEGAARHDKSTEDSRDEDEGCDNPACRATHEGHRPFRHSVSCALYRSSQDEDVYMSPRSGVDERSRKVRDSTPKSRLAERPSPVIEALHSRHDTIHRHHSPGFHGPEHVAEHLALVLDRNRHNSHTNPTGEAIGQATEEEAPKSPKVAKEAADHHHGTQQLEPLTQVQATTKVGSFRYREEPLPHGHPSHEEHLYPSHCMEPTPDNDTSQVTEPEYEANETRQTLRHVQQTDNMRDVVDRKHVSPIHDINVTRETPSRSPLRIVKRKESAMFAGQSTATKAEESQGGKKARNHPTRVAKRQEEIISKTDNSRSKTTYMEQDTKHTERTTRKEVQYPSKTEATSHGKAPITAIDAGSDDSDRKSYASDERILFNGQKKVAAPKGRLSSPPPWLKTPSKKPATVQDRLRHVDTRSHYDLSRSGREQSKRSDRPSSSARGHDSSKAAFSQPSSPKVDLQSHSKELQKTVRTQNESETWLGLPSELQQQRVTDKSVVARGKAPGFQERVSPQKQTSISHHGYESEYSDGCIFCEAPSPTPPHVRGLHGRDAVESPLGPSKVSSSSHVLGKPNHPAESTQESYRKATLRAQEELDQLRAMTCYSSNQQRTVETRVIESGLTSTPLQRRQVSFQDHVEEEIPQASEREDASSSGDGYDDAFSFSSKASNLEIHRPTPIAPPNHDCRWKDRYMALTSEIRQLKAEMSTRVSFHDADVGSGWGQDAQLQQQDEDLGIQGLTIVMHLKGKDDLVINTDLTQEAEEIEE